MGDKIAYVEKWTIPNDVPVRMRGNNTLICPLFITLM